jgi:hypothetical protein
MIIPTLVLKTGESVFPYQIKGTVDELGVLGQYVVRLYVQGTGQLKMRTVSNRDGYWVFTAMPYIENGYFVVAHDHTEPLQRGAISDYLTPELI